MPPAGDALFKVELLAIGLQHLPVLGGASGLGEGNLGLRHQVADWGPEFVSQV